MPAKGANVSRFIDIIGMPMTPFSYAGVTGAATGGCTGGANDLWDRSWVP